MFTDNAFDVDFSRLLSEVIFGALQDFSQAETFDADGRSDLLADAVQLCHLFVGVFGAGAHDLVGVSDVAHVGRCDDVVIQLAGSGFVAQIRDVVEFDDGSLPFR